MPDFYAHYLHGQKSFNRLPLEITEFISNKKLYTLALQGPDFLYFYKPLKTKNNSVMRLAGTVHSMSGFDFLDSVLKKIKIKPATDEFSYMMGCIGHFGLDSTAHPYINNMVKEMNFDHAEMEIEFDKFLLTHNNIPALKYKAHKIISITKAEAKAVADIYSGLLPSITSKEVYKAFISFKWGKHFFYAPNKISQNLKFGLLKITGLYNSFQGHIMRNVSNPKSLITNQELFSLFNASIEVTANLMKNFYEHITIQTPLSQRFMHLFA